MCPFGTPWTFGETKVGGTLPFFASREAVSATSDMAMVTAATVEPGGDFLQLSDVDERVLGRDAVVDGDVGDL